MLDLIIIGAGPGGISMAAEAIHSGISPEKILVLEKGEEHSWSIRKFYPEQKLVTANYKGQDAICSGVMCLTDTSKERTLSYLDKTISDNKINVHYHEDVHNLKKEKTGEFIIITNKNEYKTKTCVIAIGMMGKPNKPRFKVPANTKSKISYDITSTPLFDKNILVVGGGDSAAEYVQYLVEQNNTVSMSYRRDEFSRLNQINLDAINTLAKRSQIELLMKTNINEIESCGEQIRVIFEGSSKSRVYDHIVFALGGTTPKNFLTLLGIEFNGTQPIVNEGYETSIPGLFLIGDLSAGKKGGSIISAFNSSHFAMKKICNNYLTCHIT